MNNFKIRIKDGENIKGRIKNIIIVGGKNVYAEEAEKIVMIVICEVLLNENCEVTSKDLLIYCKNKMKNCMADEKKFGK